MSEINVAQPAASERSETCSSKFTACPVASVHRGLQPGTRLLLPCWPLPPAVRPARDTLVDHSARSGAGPVLGVTTGRQPSSTHRVNRGWTATSITSPSGVLEGALDRYAYRPRLSAHPSPLPRGDPEARRRDAMVRTRIRPPPLSCTTAPSSCLRCSGASATARSMLPPIPASRWPWPSWGRRRTPRPAPPPAFPTLAPRGRARRGEPRRSTRAAAAPRRPAGTGRRRPPSRRSTYTVKIRCTSAPRRAPAEIAAHNRAGEGRWLRLALLAGARVRMAWLLVWMRSRR